MIQKEKQPNLFQDFLEQAQGETNIQKSENILKIQELRERAQELREKTEKTLDNINGQIQELRGNLLGAKFEGLHTETHWEDNISEAYRRNVIKVLQDGHEFEIPETILSIKKFQTKNINIITGLTPEQIISEWNKDFPDVTKAKKNQILEKAFKEIVYEDKGLEKDLGKGRIQIYPVPITTWLCSKGECSMRHEETKRIQNVLEAIATIFNISWKEGQEPNKRQNWNLLPEVIKNGYTKKNKEVSGNHEIPELGSIIKSLKIRLSNWPILTFHRPEDAKKVYFELKLHKETHDQT